MALNALTLSTTAGVQGRRFQAVINGMTTGRVEVLTDGSPGFSTVNGRVMSDALPYPVSTLVLREYDPGGTPSFRDTRIDITAAGAPVASVAPDGTITYTGAGGGAPTAQSATAISSGPVYTITRLLGSSSTLALVAGTNGNLTLSGTTISATAAIGVGVSQTAVVSETSGSLRVDYPVVVTGVSAGTGPTLTTLTLVGTLTEAVAASGVSITGATAGSTITLNIAGLTVGGSGTTRTVTGTPAAAGALSATETLAGATNTPRVTALGTVAAAGVTAPGLSPFFDTFEVDGPLSSRAGWTGEATTANAANLPSLSTLSGNARSTFANQNIHVYRDTGAGAGASRGWAKTLQAGHTGSGGTAAGFESHVTVDLAAGHTALVTATGPAYSTITQDVIVAGSATSAFTAMIQFASSVIEHRTANDAGTMRSQIILNGRRLTVGTGTGRTAQGADIATLLGRPANGRYGFNGRISNPSLRMFGAGNDATDAAITVVSAGHIRQAGKPLQLSGTYHSPNAAVPTQAQMSVSIFDDTVNSETPLSGQADLAFASFSAANGRWEGTLAVNPTDNSYALVKWTWAGGFAVYPTGTIRTGAVVAIEGQSQVGFLTSNTVDAGTAPVPTTLPVLSMQADSGTEVGSRKLAGTPAINTAYAALTGAYQASANVPMFIANLALGGTPYSTRLPGGTVQAGGTDHWTAMVEGLRSFAGGRPDIIVFAGGTSAEGVTTYSSAGDDQGVRIRKHMIAMADLFDAEFNTTFLFGVSPEGSVCNAGSGETELRRRAMNQLTVDFPARFKLVAHRHDMQHVVGAGPTIDSLHYGGPGNTSGWVAGVSQGGGEWARRIGRGIALATGKTTENYLGPRMTAIARVDANNIDVTYNVGAFTAIEVANAGFASDFAGGHRFAGSSAFSTLLTPSSATPGAVSGGLVTIRYQFGAALPTTVFVSGPVGDNPFNVANDLTVNVSIHARASMVQATKSGMLPSMLQPSYNVGGAGIDFLTAS